MTKKFTITLVATLILLSVVIFYNIQKSTLPITPETQIEQTSEAPEITELTEVTEVASDINTDIDNIEMPASFKDVEMTTHKSEYGFEITYPKEWIAGPSELGKRDVHENSLGRFTIVPEMIEGPIGGTEFLITVESSNASSLEEELENYISRTNPNSLVRVKSLSEVEEVNLNGNTGFKKVRRQIKESLIEDFEGDAPHYFFLKNGKFYTVDFYYQPEQKVTREEALWVLSTFKIVN